MRAKEFTFEAVLGTNPKRPSRTGSRPERGHEPQKRYVTDRKTGKQYDPDEEFDKKMNSPEVMAQMKRMAQKEGVAEGSDEAEAYKAHLIKTMPQMMNFLSKKVKGWTPSEQEMLGAIDTAYTVMKHTGDVKQAGKAMMDELNTLHRMSQGQQGVAEGSEQHPGVPTSRDELYHHHLSAAKISKGRAKEHHLQQAEKYKPKQGVAEGAPIVVMPRADRLKKAEPTKIRYQGDIVPPTKPPSTEKRGVKGRTGQRPMPKYDEQFCEDCGGTIYGSIEEAKASRSLCTSSKPDADLGASMLSSCKSQGLRSRDGNKSHKLGKSKDSRVKVGGHKIKGNKYGGPLPDWS